MISNPNQDTPGAPSESTAAGDESGGGETPTSLAPHPGSPYMPRWGTAELIDALVSADERFLSELLSLVVVTRHAVGEPVDSVHVVVVELPLCGCITSFRSSYQQFFVHGPSLHVDGSWLHEYRQRVWENGCRD